MKRDKLPIAVFVSGRGTNLQSIIDAIEAGRLDAEIRLVVSNRSKAPALQRCERHGIPYEVIPSKKFETPEKWGEALIEAVKRSGAELVVLAGFMKVVPANFIEAFKNRIVNIHPSLLPAFKGLEAQRQAFDYGVKLTGCTVHLVTPELDSGPIIAQAVVPVLPNDTPETLAARILEHEHRIYPQVVQWFAEGRVRVDGNKVWVDGARYGTLPFNPELEKF
ncbi:MAG: phosphoribosylglycinamide formyltransferase [Aquificae bacterium]|nr:phosphoribosylglycinamide formyltransferase [Aquificota bacterium]